MTAIGWLLLRALVGCVDGTAGRGRTCRDRSQCFVGGQFMAMTRAFARWRAAPLGRLSLVDAPAVPRCFQVARLAVAVDSLASGQAVKNRQSHVVKAVAVIEIKVKPALAVAEPVAAGAVERSDADGEFVSVHFLFPFRPSPGSVVGRSLLPM